jgi:flagellar biosynthesis protein FliR
MLITLAIGSAAGLTSCVITILCDDFPSVKRWIITATVCISSFFIGLIYVTPVRYFTALFKTGGDIFSPDDNIFL